MSLLEGQRRQVHLIDTVTCSMDFWETSSTLSEFYTAVSISEVFYLQGCSVSAASIFHSYFRVSSQQPPNRRPRDCLTSFSAIHYHKQCDSDYYHYSIHPVPSPAIDLISTYPVNLHLSCKDACLPNPNSVAVPKLGENRHVPKKQKYEKG